MAPQFRHGRRAFLSVVIGGTTTVLSSGFDDSSLKRAVDSAEVTAYTDNDKKYLAGLRGANLDVSGHFSSTHEGRIGGVLGASTHPVWKYGPEGNTTGFRKYQFSAMVTGLDVGAPVGDKISMNFGLLVSGAVTSTRF